MLAVQDPDRDHERTAVFVKIKPEEIMKAAKEIGWNPAHMFLRMENWWNIWNGTGASTRQRIFATPIPVCPVADAVR